MRRSCCPGYLLILVSASVLAGSDFPQPGGAESVGSRPPLAEIHHEARFRRPVAACSLGESNKLYVANRDSGSVSLVDTRDWNVVGETVVGTRLSDIAPLNESGVLLALDESESVLLRLRDTADGLQVLDRIHVPRSPVSLAVSKMEDRVSVASLWSRWLTLFRIESGDSPETTVSLREAARVALPFAPRLQCWGPGGDRIIVADAFAGRLAVVHAARATVECVHELPAHNIRGLAVSADGTQLVMAHQLLDPGVGTTYDAIHWGDLALNLIRVIPLPMLWDPDSDLVAAGRSIRIGSTGHGAGDPGMVLPLEDGRVVAVASGVDRAEVFPMSHSVVTPWLETGRRPTAVALAPGGTHAAVLNTLDDSLTVIDLAADEVSTTVSLGPTPEPGPAQRGESLFFDARLSHDHWISCHSCHTDGHTNGLLVDTTSDGTLCTPKRVLSLLGTRDNNPWAWNGSLRSLHDQVRHSVTASMQGLRPTSRQVIDLVAYLHTLEAPPPLAPSAVSETDAELLGRGREVFAAEHCGRCHVPPLTYTSDQLVDVGLVDERGLSKFNPPSLRGISQQTRFFHDGRAGSLRAVFEEYGHQLETGLDEEELQALVRFLQSL